MAKGKKEDPNVVAQRKSERVAFVQAHPNLDPEVARQRFFVQTRATELESAGKPVDRAALRDKFQSGDISREGFYTPADVNRFAGSSNNNSLGDTKNIGAGLGNGTPTQIPTGLGITAPTYAAVNRTDSSGRSGMGATTTQTSTTYTPPSLTTPLGQVVAPQVASGGITPPTLTRNVPGPNVRVGTKSVQPDTRSNADKIAASIPGITWAPNDPSALPDSVIGTPGKSYQTSGKGDSALTAYSNWAAQNHNEMYAGDRLVNSALTVGAATLGGIFGGIEGAGLAAGVTHNVTNRLSNWYSGGDAGMDTTLKGAKKVGLENAAWMAGGAVLADVVGGTIRGIKTARNAAKLIDEIPALPSAEAWKANAFETNIVDPLAAPASPKPSTGATTPVTTKIPNKITTWWNGAPDAAGVYPQATVPKGKTWIKENGEFDVSKWISQKLTNFDTAATQAKDPKLVPGYGTPLSPLRGGEGSLASRSAPWASKQDPLMPVLADPPRLSGKIPSSKTTEAEQARIDIAAEQAAPAPTTETVQGSLHDAKQAEMQAAADNPATLTRGEKGAATRAANKAAKDKLAKEVLNTPVAPVAEPVVEAPKLTVVEGNPKLTPEMKNHPSMGTRAKLEVVPDSGTGTKPVPPPRQGPKESDADFAKRNALHLARNSGEVNILDPRAVGINDTPLSYTERQQARFEGLGQKKNPTIDDMNPYNTGDSIKPWDLDPSDPYYRKKPSEAKPVAAPDNSLAGVKAEIADASIPPRPAGLRPTAAYNPETGAWGNRYLDKKTGEFAWSKERTRFATDAERKASAKTNRKPDKQRVAIKEEAVKELAAANTVSAASPDPIPGPHMFAGELIDPSVKIIKEPGAVPKWADQFRRGPQPPTSTELSPAMQTWLDTPATPALNAHYRELGIVKKQNAGRLTVAGTRQPTETEVKELTRRFRALKGEDTSLITPGRDRVAPGATSTSMTDIQSRLEREITDVFGSDVMTAIKNIAIRGNTENLTQNIVVPNVKPEPKVSIPGQKIAVNQIPTPGARLREQAAPFFNASGRLKGPSGARRSETWQRLVNSEWWSKLVKDEPTFAEYLMGQNADISGIARMQVANDIQMTSEHQLGKALGNKWPLDPYVTKGNEAAAARQFADVPDANQLLENQANELLGAYPLTTEDLASGKRTPEQMTARRDAAAIEKSITSQRSDLRHAFAQEDNAFGQFNRGEASDQFGNQVLQDYGITDVNNNPLLSRSEVRVGARELRSNVDPVTVEQRFNAKRNKEIEAVKRSILKRVQSGDIHVNEGSRQLKAFVDSRPVYEGGADASRSAALELKIKEVRAGLKAERNKLNLTKEEKKATKEAYDAQVGSAVDAILNDAPAQNTGMPSNPFAPESAEMVNWKSTRLWGPTPEIVIDRTTKGAANIWKQAPGYQGPKEWHSGDWSFMTKEQADLTDQIVAAKHASLVAETTASADAARAKIAETFRGETPFADQQAARASRLAAQDDPAQVKTRWEAQQEARRVAYANMVVKNVSPPPTKYEQWATPGTYTETVSSKWWGNTDDAMGNYTVTIKTGTTFEGGGKFNIVSETNNRRSPLGTYGEKTATPDPEAVAAARQAAYDEEKANAADMLKEWMGGTD